MNDAFSLHVNYFNFLRELLRFLVYLLIVRLTCYMVFFLSPFNLRHFMVNFPKCSILKNLNLVNAGAFQVQTFHKAPAMFVFANSSLVTENDPAFIKNG